MLCPGLPQSIELDERRQQELVVGRDFANRSTRINFLHLDSNAREFKGMLSRPQHARFFFDLESSKWTVSFDIPFPWNAALSPGPIDELETVW